MLWLFLILAAEPAAEAQPTPEPAPPAAVALPPEVSPPVERPSALAQTGAHLAFAGGVVASSMLATVMVYGPGALHYDRTGRPEPLVPITAMIFAGAFKVAATYFLLPELYRVGGGTPDIEATRQQMWKLVRWPAVAAGVSILLLLLGAGLEYDNFGRGQNVMIAGAIALTVSHGLFDILSIVGSSQGYRR